MKALFLAPIAGAFLLLQSAGGDVSNILATRSTGGVYLIPNVSSVAAARVYRNGLRMAPGFDYSLKGNVITPAPAFPWADSDIVLVDYSK
jgi:hypothetical protein